MIISILLIFTSVIISTIGTIYVYRNRENFGNSLNVVLNILIYLFLGIFFFSTYYLSTYSFISEEISLILWHLSIVFWIFSLSMLNIIHRFIIKLEEKGIFTTIFYSLIIGIILGLNFLSDSFEVRIVSSNYTFIFHNSLLLILLLTYNSIVFSLMWYNLLRYFSRIRDKKSRMLLSILTFQFSFLIFLYSIYIITQSIIVRAVFIGIYLTGALFATYIIIKKPSLFIELTNRIHDFIIFHKSGILLYSYNFETGEETDESLLKGSILIGINHILSNFIDKKDQLNLIKMKNRDIILEYDKLLGFALLLTTNHKNSFIEKAVSKFMNKFVSLNQEKLMKLTGLIDVSEFGNTRELISEFFNPYILNQK